MHSLSFPNGKRVKLFILGDNNWQFFSHWPPPEVKPVTFHLNSQNNANVKNSDGSLEQEPIYKNDFDEYNAGEIEGWGSLNPDGTSFIAPDAIDDDINDPIKSLADYEKPIDQPDMDD